MPSLRSFLSLRTENWDLEMHDASPVSAPPPVAFYRWSATHHRLRPNPVSSIHFTSKRLKLLLRKFFLLRPDCSPHQATKVCHRNVSFLRVLSIRLSSTLLLAHLFSSRITHWIVKNTLEKKVLTQMTSTRFKNSVDSASLSSKQKKQQMRTSCH